MGRISDCHCEEEHRSDVAISTLAFAPLAMTIMNDRVEVRYDQDIIRLSREHLPQSDGGIRDEKICEGRGTGEGI